MALRVLLADESSTIKKVMQLALQDFGVEVKAVPIGLDVMQVARSFQPDVIFADVLLSKKSGYEVSAEVKSDPALRSTPVVLMWSGFMELDEAKAKSCGAERRLEKPFDADHLRALVKDLVPRLNENRISDYLVFPDLPEIVETPPPAAQQPAPAKAAPPPAPAPAPVAAAPVAPTPAVSQATSMAAQALNNLSAPKAPVSKAPPPPAPPKKVEAPAVNIQEELVDLEDPDEFQQVPLPGSKGPNLFEKKDEEEWRQGGLEQFRVAPAEPEIEINTDEAYVDLTNVGLSSTDSSEDIQLEDLEEVGLAHHESNPSATVSRTFRSSETPLDASSYGVVDPVRVEEILREQVREVLENIAWKIIPDLAERVIREEVQRLMKEAERLQ